MKTMNQDNQNNLASLNRRQFLRTTGQTATTLAAASTFAPALLSADPRPKPIGVGCIGLGTRGGDLINAVAHVPNVKVWRSAMFMGRIGRRASNAA